MSSKIRLAVLCGGQSAEHQVALLSAKSIVDALDRSKYDLILIGIDKSGKWAARDSFAFLENAGDLHRIALIPSNDEVVLTPSREGCTILSLATGKRELVDVVFPVLHGTQGEDGTVQGFCKLSGVPCVGAGVLGSAVGMDKDVMKRLLRDAGVPIARFLVFEDREIAFDRVVRELGLPFFVKPANAGSSVGVKKVEREEDFREALDEAFRYDRKILIEEYIQGRELECSVLGNAFPIASLPGEVIPSGELYSYEGKYQEAAGTRFEIPVVLEPFLTLKVQNLAIHAFQVLCCQGMARVDMFLREDGELLVNEINTIPGFTQMSMYPKLWEASGLPLSVLLDRLIELALERFTEEQHLQWISKEDEEYQDELSEVSSGNWEK